MFYFTLSNIFSGINDATSWAFNTTPDADKSKLFLNVKKLYSFGFSGLQMNPILERHGVDDLTFKAQEIGY
jgi:hypothetical protein